MVTARPTSGSSISGGLLTSVDLDLHHRGRPERRLVYRPDGTLDHLEADPDGDGEFKVVTSKADEGRAQAAIQQACVGGPNGLDQEKGRPVI